MQFVIKLLFSTIVLFSLSACDMIEIKSTNVSGRLKSARIRDLGRKKLSARENNTTVDITPVAESTIERSLNKKRTNSTIRANRRFFSKSNSGPSFPAGYYSLTPPPNYGAEDDSPTLQIKSHFKNKYSRNPQMQGDSDVSGAIQLITDQIESTENGYQNRPPTHRPYGEKIMKNMVKYNSYTPNRYHRKVPNYVSDNPSKYNSPTSGGYVKTTRHKPQKAVPVTEAPGKFEEIYKVGNLGQLPLQETPPNLYGINSYQVPYNAMLTSTIKIDAAPPAASVQPDPDYNLKAIKVEMYKSEGQAFMLNDDGTLSVEGEDHTS